MSKPVKPYLNVVLNEDGVNVDAVLPNGFAIKINSGLSTLMPLIQMVIAEVQKSLKGDESQ